MSSDGDQRPTLLIRTVPQRSRMSAAERNLFRQFLFTLSEQLAGSRAFTCLLTGDRELQRLNREFLGHDYPTDVLSFPNTAGIGYLGEIAISLERAEVQGREHGHTRLDEARILLLHGVLHLIGFDHEHDRGAMARAERKWRRALGLAPTLIERTAAAQEARRQ